MLSFLQAVARLIVKRVQSLFRRQAKRGFSRINGPNFTLWQGMRGSLVYQETGGEYVVNASEGGGYSIIVEQMGDVDIKLTSLPVGEKIRIARDIRDALLREGIDAEVIYENHLMNGNP
jgi:hypothetical protein